MKQVTAFTVFKELVITDFVIFKSIFKDKIINLLIWVTTTVAVNCYLMPYFGMPASYGPFMLAGACASIGVFESYGAIMRLVSDIEGDFVLGYYATLPLPTWLIFMRLIVYQALNTFFLGMLALPIGNLFLEQPISLASINWPTFLSIFALSYIFYGALVLFAASFIKSMLHLENVWMRIMYPLWFLGGFQFSWYALHKIAPKCAYINLLNPITYVTEGVRGTMLGSTEYISPWICMGMLILFTFFCGFVGITRLIKRLDFV